MFNSLRYLLYTHNHTGNTNYGIRRNICLASSQYERTVIKPTLAENILRRNKKYLQNMSFTIKQDLLGALIL